ncbi:MAG: hypothetical protein BGO30_08390 [Bacteroidetes bacterium 41-46]|nr:MAG: hypothetical protein BGO30_08390 [Bacteroidetes bacterium 41-46]
MKIGLIDVDGHGFPNIALMKISSFHKYRKDIVEMATIGDYDICYVSKLFNFSEDPNSSLISYKHLYKGGTGYDIKSKLPIRIENCQPDYSIYPLYKFSLQFFSRGCIRSCPFCVVREKEGYITPAKPMNLNPQGKYIEVLDNNFFANPEWKSAISYLLEANQPVNFHGVDVRIMDEEQAYHLNLLKHRKQIHIAWDFPEMDLLPKLNEVIKYIKPYKLMCYVLIGFNSSPEQDLYRVTKLNELGISPFVMPFNKSDKYQKRFARWVNHKAVFKSVKWENYK